MIVTVPLLRGQQKWRKSPAWSIGLCAHIHREGQQPMTTVRGGALARPAALTVKAQSLDRAKTHQSRNKAIRQFRPAFLHVVIGHVR